MIQKGYLRTASTPLKPGDIGGDPQKFVYGPEILTPWMDEPEKHRSLLKVLDFWRQAYRGIQVQWCLNVCKVGGYTAPEIIALIDAAAATAAAALANYLPLDGSGKMTGLVRSEQHSLTLTGDENNVIVPKSVLLVDTDGSHKITGIAAVSGALIKVENVGTNNLVLGNQDAGSNATNRIITGLGLDYTIAPDNGVWLSYDDEDSRWRVNS